MLDLFLAEWRRFGRFSLAAAAGHLLLQLAAYQTGTRLLDMGSSNQMSLVLLYAAASLLFALVQLNGYRAANRWVWLMHRPQPRLAIFGGLAMAGAAHILLAIALPLMLTVLATDLFTATSADMRHYIGLLVLGELCLMAWLVAAIAVFGRMWVGLASAVLPFLMLSHTSRAGIELLLATLLLGLLSFIAYENCRPDRHQPPAGGGTNLLLAIPLVLGFSLVFFIASTMVVTFIERGLGIGAEGRPTVIKGSPEQIHGMDAKPRMQARLAASGHPRAAMWQEQLAGASLAFVVRDYFDNSIRQPLSNANQPGPFRTADGASWRFDHDRMLFVGVNKKTGQSLGMRGLYGAGDLTPFPLVPYNGRFHDASKEFLMLPQRALQLDDGTLNYHPRIALTAPERFIGIPKNIGGRYYAFTSKRLIVYQPVAQQPDAPFAELYSVPLPDWPSRMDQIEIAPLADVTLISMAGSNYSGPGPHTQQQRMIAVDQAGKASLVEETSFQFNFSDRGLPNAMWIVTPVVATAAFAYSQLHSAFGKDGAARHDLRLPFVESRNMALALLLASCSMAWMWLRHRPPRFKAAWMVACLIFGPAALATLAVLHPRQCSRPDV